MSSFALPSDADGDDQELQQFATPAFSGAWTSNATRRDTVSTVTPATVLRLPSNGGDGDDQFATPAFTTVPCGDAPCANPRCTINGGIASSTHKCPGCHKNVHGPCGKETGNLAFILCPLCEGQAANTEEATTTGKTKNRLIDANATMADVEMGTESIYPLARGAGNQKTTRLKAIRGLETVLLQAKELRDWFTSLKYTIKRNATKEHLCEAICQAKVRIERRAQAPGAPLPDDGTAAAPPSNINYCRFINVVSTEAIKNALATKGAALTREQLDRGDEADADFYGEVAEMYNSLSAELDTLKWVVDWQGNEPDPSEFTPIDESKAKRTWAQLGQWYAKVDSNNQVSGEHGDFSDFVGTRRFLIYLHLAGQECPAIIDAFKDDVDEGGNTAGKPAPKKKQKRAEKKADPAFSVIAQAQQKKASAIAYTFNRKSLKDYEKEARKLSKKIKRNYGEFKNQGIFLKTKEAKEFVEMVRVGKETGIKDLLSDDDSIASETPEGLANKIIELENRLAETQGSVARVKELVRRHEEADDKGN